MQITAILLSEFHHKTGPMVKYQVTVVNTLLCDLEYFSAVHFNRADWVLNISHYDCRSLFVICDSVYCTLIRT